MFSAFKNKLFSIKTSDTLDVVNKWIAVISVLITFLILALAMWKLLVDEYKDPINISQPRTSSKVEDNSILNSFWYFDGIAISDPSTNFASGGDLNLVPSTTEMASKCKMFGNDCMGFDTLGSLFLARDRKIATLKGLQKQYTGGLYISTEKDHAKQICERLGGDFEAQNRVCNNFERSAIKDYPFPDVQ